MTDGDEEEQLKSVSLRNSQAILAARLKAERELVQAKEALARKADELAAEREWFRAILACINDAVITTDIEGKVTFLNPEAELLTGWSSSEALDQKLETVFNIINKKTRQAATTRIADVLREGSAAAPPRIIELIAKNGMETTIEDSATPLRDVAAKVYGVVIVFRELAERVRSL